MLSKEMSYNNNYYQGIDYFLQMDIDSFSQDETYNFISSICETEDLQSILHLLKKIKGFISKSPDEREVISSIFSEEELFFVSAIMIYTDINQNRISVLDSFSAMKNLDKLFKASKFYKKSVQAIIEV